MTQSSDKWQPRRFFANATLRLCLPVAVVAAGLGALLGRFVLRSICEGLIEVLPPSNTTDEDAFIFAFSKRHIRIDAFQSVCWELRVEM